MGKFYLICIICIAIILGIVTVLTQGKSSTNQNFAVQNYSATPTNALNGLQIQQQSQQQAPQQQQQQTQQQGRTPAVVPQSLWVTNATSAAIKTVKGEIDIQLYNQDAPKTVTNFATLSKIGYYNNLTFHRVEPGFVIQGGDPNGDGTGGQSIYGLTFEDELNPNTPSYQAGYQAGVVAMANRGPNTNGSQFFILLADHPELPKNYSIFGKVTSGMDVVQQIQKGDKILTIIIQ